MQVYDYFITFEREVEFIWPSKWTFIKTLFFVTRYSPFLDVTLDVFRAWHFSRYREQTSYGWAVVADHRLEPRRWLVVYLVSRCRSIFQWLRGIAHTLTAYRRDVLHRDSLGRRYEEISRCPLSIC